MAALMELFSNDQRIWRHGPCARAVVETSVWNFAIEQLAGGHWTLLGLWGETDVAHMALLEETAAHIAIASLNCAEGRYPSVGRRHPPAIRLERAIRDLVGLEPEGLPDMRPWLDHGHWATLRPLGHQQPPEPMPSYAFLSADGPGLHQIAVGPVHAGIIEPGHFRFTANGETVVRLEERLGYVHKGIESLMIGANLGDAVRLAGRASGDSTVAYSLAFSRAAEAALRIEAPPRAVWLRALMAEMERLANHIGDIGAICNDAAFAIMHTHCGVLRERVLRAAGVAFGHRLMRDRIVPGGITVDLSREGASSIQAVVTEIKRQFPRLVELYDNTASLQDRTVSTGVLTSALARQFGVGGYVGRASGRHFDARRGAGYPPYDKLHFEIPILTEGDVNARVWIRIREVEQSLSLIEQIMKELPVGPVRIDIADVHEPREGLALVEGFRGDILTWLHIAADGAVARCHLRDPSWFQWPLLEAVIEGNIVADFPLCNKSFNCSYSGHDL
ncbi:MAG: NADH-quinone oxidoreductase subunit C [Proteobacteria bacterium]|nr:NADH-quinone oxidoreductase subunit C [Pseudomonadota bacterium]